MTEESTPPARESMHYDVVVVGAGPAGLTVAIPQIAEADIPDVIVEKGSPVGAHILAGGVIDRSRLDRSHARFAIGSGVPAQNSGSGASILTI